MKQFLSASDVPSIPIVVEQALHFKQQPFSSNIGNEKTLGLLFFNPSLRTRLSTIKAAKNLGMEVMLMNVTQDSWQLETEEGVVMSGDKAEHVKEAAAVIGQYCEVLAIRSFPQLVDRMEDYEDKIIKAFVSYSGRPVINLESATLHPLQSLADVITIDELKSRPKPKVVLSWAPHVKPLPQSVGNSFAQWMNQIDCELVVTNPPGFDLSKEFVGNAEVIHDQAAAFDGADFVYAKNWASYENYGEVGDFPDWIIDNGKMTRTNNAYFMHCLPVRRNVVVCDSVLDGPRAAHIQQANNRTWAAQAVLYSILKQL